MLHSCFGIGDTTLGVTISADTADFNLFTAAGSPSGIVNVVCTINAGVEVYGSGTVGVPAFHTGSGWAAGSTIKIINNGSIHGFGGDAGDGGVSTRKNGFNGRNGGDALKLGINITLDNTTTGQIFGGGGGGGGGGWCHIAVLGAYNGGGGGGGAGRSGGAAGFGSGSASNGTHGDDTGPGNGGAGGVTTGNPGGKGGGFGTVGVKGKTYSASGVDDYGTGGTAGSGGNAIALNGYAVTWVQGNNTTQVKGDVA